MKTIKKVLFGLLAAVISCQLAGCQTIGNPAADSTVSLADESAAADDILLPTTVRSTTVKAEDPDIVIGYADLTHDGAKEKLAVNLTGLNDNTSCQAVLKVYSPNGAVIWTGTVGTDHAGEDSYYLYTDDGEDYLMEYDPHINMGMGSYSYAVYGLFDDGTKDEISSQHIEFNVSAVSAPVFHFDVAELLSFYESVNFYLGKSYLLLSSLPQDVFADCTNPSVNSVAYSTETKRLTGRETYDDLLGVNSNNNNKPMKDRLENYRKDLLKEYQENKETLSSAED